MIHQIVSAGTRCEPPQKGWRLVLWRGPNTILFTFQDNCPRIKNSDQADLDDDGIGDICDEDLDGDGIKNDQVSDAEADRRNNISRHHRTRDGAVVRALASWRHVWIEFVISYHSWNSFRENLDR